MALSLWRNRQGINQRGRRRKLSCFNYQEDMDSDQSKTDPSQAFLRVVETDVAVLKAIKSEEYHNENRSFSSSISSREGEKLRHQFSLEDHSTAVDNIPVNENSCDETRSISKSKSNSTNCNDETAIAITNQLKRRGSLNITTLLAERASIIESITWLGRHVPRCVMRDLSKEAMRLHKKQDLTLVMPSQQIYRASLLFIDISGFTKLSLLLDIESLSKSINSYFQKIVDEVTNHGGDILKFAGDAVFAEWRVQLKSDSLRSIGSKEEKHAIDECVERAAACGASVVAKCSDYPVFESGDEGVQISTLNVHCGVAFGDMAALHVGNDYNRREFLVLGQTIDQVTQACDAATYGELVASPEAFDILQGSMQKGRFGIKPKKKSNQPVKIASRNEYLFDDRKRRHSFTRNNHRKSLPVKEYQIAFDKMDITSLKYLQKILSFYVHPVVVSEETVRPNNRGDIKLTQERHRSEAELRSVYTLFIKPIIQAELTNDPKKNEKSFNILNDTLNVVTSILDSFRGHLRQFIVDDKGVILIATFGLRGSTSPNMASERVLPAARTIHFALQDELGVNNYVGTTLGKVYCGVVGGIKRHEFAVLGPSVNLSARLLSMPNHPGILVNNDVRQVAMKWGIFLPFPPMKAKGYSELVPVYQPITARETRWGKANPRFVGRKIEMKRVTQLAKKIALEDEGPAEMFFVWGESGSGKSDFLVQTVAQARKAIITLRKRVIVSRNIGTDGDALVPFSLFRSVFRDLLVESAIEDSSSLIASKHDSVSLRERDWENSSISTMSTMNSALHNASAERFQAICDELGAPRGFLQIVGYHLLGHSKRTTNTKDRAPIFDEIVNFMAKVFLHLTANADLTILALDDIHHADNISWKVLQTIFETGKNILLLCGSRPISSRKLHVDDNFWTELTGSYRENDRFQDLNIGPLSRLEIAQMAALALSCQVKDVDIQFTKDIYDHTRGMPHFAAQVLDICKRKGLYERLENNKIGWRKGTKEFKIQFSTLDELLLQRIDDLDDFTRKTLRLAAVLGQTFTLVDIIEISRHILSINAEEEDDHSNNVLNSLDIAIQEGILDVLESTGEDIANIKKDENMSFSEFPDISNEEKLDESTAMVQQTDTCYRFCHDTWRQKILSLLLDSYIRDIHIHAASAIELRISNIEEVDYRTKMRLLHHQKESGNTLKSADLSLSVGKNFVQLGLNLHSIHVYDAALSMWRNDSSDDKARSIDGFSMNVIESLDKSDLVSIIKLQTAKGQALGTLTRKLESAKAFENALEIFKEAPIKTEIKDRSFIFPIYSGLFFLLKYGGMVEPSEELTYEHNLVMNFVEETRLNGDPVHYSRSLAMLSEFYSRQGQYEDALVCHEKLKRVYNVDAHSALVVEAYASDRSAQNYGISANCLYRLGRVKEALQLSDTVLYKMMPKMDLQNVHNSMVMIYPILWILKEEKRPKEAVSALEGFVFKPFDEHFGTKGKTFSLVLFKPLKALFTILMYMQGIIKKVEDSIMSWALEKDSMVISSSVDNSFANFARCGSSVCAEVCLLLSKYTTDGDVKKQLIEKGWGLAQIAMKTAEKCGSHQTAYFQTKPVYDELQGLVNSLE